MKDNSKLICYCPCCKSETNHQILARETMKSDPQEDFWWNSHFSLVKCLGCDNIQFHKEDLDETSFETDEEGTEYSVPDICTFPRSKNLVDPIFSWDIPSEISVIYSETMDCLNRKSFQLAAAGFRSVIECFCRYEKIEGKELKTMINNLAKKHIITNQDRDNLHAIRFMGNDTIHGLKQYKQNEVVIVAHIVNTMLTSRFVIASEVKNLDVLPVKKLSEFIDILNAEISKRVIGSVDILRNFVKHERRIISEDLPEFEKQLQAKIADGSYTNLALSGTPQQNKHQQYKIVSH